MAHNAFVIETHPPRISVQLAQERLELHPLWLRERSAHPEQLDAITEQRLFNPHQLDPALSLLQLRDEVREASVASGQEFSLKDFHRTALDLGGLGLDVLRAAVLDISGV